MSVGGPGGTNKRYKNPDFKAKLHFCEVSS